MIPRIDEDLIRSKFSELNKYLKELQRLRNIGFKEFSSSLTKQWTVFHGLQLSIQIVIDVGNHILAAIGENRIDEYVDIIDNLGKRKIIPLKFSREIRGMAGLRNILVHEYAQIDAKKIYIILQDRLKDFYDFMRYINKYLKKIS